MLLYMQSYNPAIPGKHVNKKKAGKPHVLAISALPSSLAAIAEAFSAVAFYILLPLIMMQSHRQSQLCANLMYHESDLGQAGYPNLKCLHGKI